MDLYQIVCQLLICGAIYGGIRSDLKHVKQSTDEAHKRIDALLMAGK